MNSSSNMDQKLKQLENQSIPDMSHQDMHWQEMKKLLVTGNGAVPKTSVTHNYWYWFIAACVSSIIIYLVVNSSGKTTKTMLAEAGHDTQTPSSSTLVQDTVPVAIITLNEKDTVRFKVKQPVKRTGTSLQLKARTSAGKDTILEVRSVVEIPVATKTQVPDPQKSLAFFFEQLEKPSQEFMIDNRRDTLLWGTDGTALLIPANSFHTKEKIKITLREFYSYQDIITHKLNTTSDGQQLETGGMLHVSASINGKEIELPRSERIRWFLPDTSANMEDMRLFTLAPGSQAVLYQRNPHSDTLDFANSGAINWRISGNTFDRSYVNMSIQAVDLRDLPYKTSTGKKNKGYFFLNSNSEFSRDELKIKLREKYPHYDRVIISGKRKRKSWNDGWFAITRNELADTRYSIGDTTWLLPFEIKAHKLTPLDTLTYTWNNNSSAQVSASLNKQLKKVVGKYSVDIDKLGWINCDRFYLTNKQKVQYMVNLGDTAANYHTFLVFDRIKSMMSGYTAGNKVIFANVPAGEKVKVISVGIREGKTVAAMADVELSNSVLNSLKFEPTTPNSFREQVATLDQ